MEAVLKRLAAKPVKPGAVMVDAVTKPSLSMNSKSTSTKITKTPEL